MLDPALLAFRPLRSEDLARVHGWFHAPHAERWFGRGRSLPDVIVEYGEYIEGRVPIHPFVVTHAARDIGLVEWERFGDFPDFMQLYAVDDPDACNCDILIGDPDFIHRGLGSHVVLRFLRELVFVDPRITKCVIDPEVENVAAIRAYEKAGFRFSHRIEDDGDGKPLHLMTLTRAELMRPAVRRFDTE